MSLRPANGLPLRALAGVCTALVLLAGCNKNNKAEPPASLVRIRETVRVEKIWSSGVGGAAPNLRLGLGVATEGGRVYAAGHDGDVEAYSLANGKSLWHTKTRVKIAGGPGAGEGLVVVGASYGDIVALDAATGALRWKTRLNSEILSAPAIGGGVVLLRAVDGRLVALSADNGRQLWAAEQNVPRLSLRGAAAPTIAGEMAISGFDNGRVMAIGLRDGQTAWDVAVAQPSGRSELERLVDIDSGLSVVGDDVYAVTYQGKVARLARDSGQVWWSRDISSYRGLATDDDGVYVSTSEGQLVKIGRRTGVELWRSDTLKNRRLSAPAVIGGQVAVADFQGIVHFFDASTGTPSARIGGGGFGSVRFLSGGARVTSPPVVVGDVVLFINDKGQVTAYRVAGPRRR
ncbi:MAG: hypothetical protein RLZZ200_2890 [Pseudomonadota bacterium]|jgi:outer membrane protein assembly factor BamB